MYSNTDMEKLFSGTVTNPDDLGPAIRALGEKGREFLEAIVCLGRDVTADDVAHAADFERGIVHDGT